MNEGELVHYSDINWTDQDWRARRANNRRRPRAKGR